MEEPTCLKWLDLVVWNFLFLFPKCKGIDVDIVGVFFGIK